MTNVLLFGTAPLFCLKLRMGYTSTLASTRVGVVLGSLLHEPVPEHQEP